MFHIRVMEINVTKIDQTENSTISKLWIDSKFIGFILEDGEHESKIHGQTRIPGGRYRIIKDYSTKFKYQFGYCWHILDVPNFSEIKIHKGNWITDTEGCLLPCREMGFDGKNFYGINSKAAYDPMMKMLSGSNEHWIDMLR